MSYMSIVTLKLIIILSLSIAQCYSHNYFVCFNYVFNMKEKYIFE